MSFYFSSQLYSKIYVPLNMTLILHDFCPFQASGRKKFVKKILGPFIRGKIRRELYHLYEHVLSKTRTARINGSPLISVLDSFSCVLPVARATNKA